MNVAVSSAIAETHHGRAPDIVGDESAEGKTIGQILLQQGRLRPEEVEQTFRYASEHGVLFGQAAKQLKLLSEAEVQLALARQFDYGYMQQADAAALSPQLVAASAPNSMAAESLRALRSQLMSRWFAAPDAHRALAVVSAGRGEGRSWTTANLAIAFAQLGQRCLLIDADLRHPCQHDLFGLPGHSGLSSLLSGRGQLESLIHPIAGLRDLSVMPAGVVPPNPQELLARPLFSSLLAQLSEHYAVILIDTPPAGEYADAQTVAARTGGAVLIARKDHSSTTGLRRVSNDLLAAGAQILGCVINKY